MNWQNTEVLWCTNSSRGRSNLWSFPTAVEKLLRSACAGKHVLHPFGGMAKFGLRMDIDIAVCPEVVADAWLPPFGRDTFDVVILDPPYLRFNAQEKVALFRQYAWIARERIIWFHTMWAGTYGGVTADKAFLVRVGDHCYVRALQFFGIRQPKRAPFKRYLRGPGMKYNRWLIQPQGLPFTEVLA